MLFLYFIATLEKALYFPNKGVDDYVRIPDMPRLTAFTVCLWVSSTDNRGTVFSYNVPGQSDDIHNLAVEFNGNVLSFIMPYKKR